MSCKCKTRISGPQDVRNRGMPNMYTLATGDIFVPQSIENQTKFKVLMSLVAANVLRY